MTTKRLRLWGVSLALAALALASATASLTPELGRDELRFAPLTLGVAVAFLWASAELVAQFGSTVARVSATIGLAFGLVVLLIRLAAGYFAPAAARDFDTWDLWPIFTAFQMALVSVPCFGVGLFAGVSSLVVRWAGRV